MSASSSADAILAFPPVAHQSDGGVYSCRPELYQQVLLLVGSEETALEICSNHPCTSLGAVGCVTQHLTEWTKDVQIVQQQSADLVYGLDVLFLLTCAFLVFIMQLGFALLCAGCVRSKNSTNILLKNVADSCVVAIGYYLLGYAFSFGTDPNRPPNAFIGNWDFALSRIPDAYDSDDLAVNMSSWHHFIFMWGFCAAATTIVSGAVAERCAVMAYLAAAFFMSAFVFPVGAHWLWSPVGWLSAWLKHGGGYGLILGTGAIDFAGAGVVHLCGGCAAMVGTLMLGPRIGRFDASGKPQQMQRSSATLVVMGSFLLWFGFYGFNCGSNVLISSQASAVIVARVAVTTTLAGATSGLVMLFFKFWRHGVWDCVSMCNAVLCGMVCITASCAVVEPWAAIIVNLPVPLIFTWAEDLLLRCGIDDPVSAVPMHAAVGAWGVLVPGFLAKPQFIAAVYGVSQDAHTYGLFYGGHGQLLLAQVVELLAIAAWSLFMMGGFFYVLRLAGVLRVPIEQELAGLDNVNANDSMTRRHARQGFKLATNAAIDFNIAFGTDDVHHNDRHSMFGPALPFHLQQQMQDAPLALGQQSKSVRALRHNGSSRRLRAQSRTVSLAPSDLLPPPTLGSEPQVALSVAGDAGSVLPVQQALGHRQQQHAAQPAAAGPPLHAGGASNRTG